MKTCWIMTSLLILSTLGACQPSAPTPQPRAPEPPLATPQAKSLPLLRAMPEIEDTDPDPARILARLEAQTVTDREGARYTYNGLSPGPVIRGKPGDWLEITLQNQLEDATTIHWHGLQVPFAMDGVAWRGAPVLPGEDFVYQFRLPGPGTYWYHPHFNTEKQVDGGLYGALIIEDPDDPVPDQDLVFLFDTEQEFDEAQDDLPENSPHRHAHGHGKLTPRWRINGQVAPVQLTPRGGSVVRVRMINASNAGYLDLRWPGMRLLGADQGLFPALQTPEHIVLGPGDRIDAEWLIGEQGFTMQTWPWSLNGGTALGAPTDLVQVEVQEPAAAPAGLPWPFEAQAPSFDPPYTDITYTFSGSDRTGLWLINGEKFPNVTIHELELGQEAILEIRNLSPTEHPFHLHGLVFEVLSINGQPPAQRRIEDTLNLRIRDRVRLKVLADNPGDWMTHCHILPHAEDGMMTVLRVLPP